MLQRKKVALAIAEVIALVCRIMSVPVTIGLTVAHITVGTIGTISPSLFES